MPSSSPLGWIPKKARAAALTTLSRLSSGNICRGCEPTTWVKRMSRKSVLLEQALHSCGVVILSGSNSLGVCEPLFAPACIVFAISDPPPASDSRSSEHFEQVSERANWLLGPRDKLPLP